MFFSDTSNGRSIVLVPLNDKEKSPLIGLPTPGVSFDVVMV